MMPVELWISLASTYSYLAVARIESAATARGVELIWRPFLLGPIFAARGWSTSPFVLDPVKGRYMWRDVERGATALGIPFRRPSRFPRPSTLAARIALVGADEGWAAAFCRGVLAANYAHDLEIDDPDVLDGILADLGRDGPSERARAVAPAHRPRLRRQTERAAELGIFGAPTFRVGDELFWGNDRLEQALAYAARGGE